MLLGAGRRTRTAAGAAVAMLAVAAGGVAVFGTHAFGFATVLQRQQQLVTPNSFVVEVGKLFGQARVTALDRTMVHVALAAAVAYLLVRVWRGADWLSGAGWALMAAAITTTWLLSWYTLWALPFAAVGRDRRLLVAVLVVQALYLVHRSAPLMVSP
jgi:hypothetical protein